MTLLCCYDKGLWTYLLVDDLLIRLACVRFRHVCDGTVVSMLDGEDVRSGEHEQVRRLISLSEMERALHSNVLQLNPQKAEASELTLFTPCDLN